MDRAKMSPTAKIKKSREEFPKKGDPHGAALSCPATRGAEVELPNYHLLHFPVHSEGGGGG